ncbi:MAG: DUF58 domain-containing protein [Planctomycetia bacterium]|nr:DUF58 domain-containing protein [Planctomycetia bacterium]
MNDFFLLFASGHGETGLSLFWLIPLALTLLFVPGVFKGIYPTGRTVLFLLIPMLFSCFYFVISAEEALWSVVLFNGVLAVFLLLDFLTVLKLDGLRVARDTERLASLGQEQKVRIRIENRLQFGRLLEVRDDVPGDLSSQAGIFPGKRYLKSGQQEDLGYAFCPESRGRYEMLFVYLAVYGLLGLWKRILAKPCRNELFVYPNLRQIKEYELLARSDRLHLLGVRVSRKIGQDNDFERLRDYTSGDSYKLMDWKATARRRKLTVRDFQMNRSQRVLFLLDTGRMMTNMAPAGPRALQERGSDHERFLEELIAGRDGDAQRITLLDHSLNAMLMLAYVALRQGDEVGFLAFSRGIRQYIPARGGMDHMNRLIHGSFDLFPVEEESRYDLAFNWLAKRCSKRSLVILMTQICDERNTLQIEKQLLNLVGRHLPFGVFLRDHAMFDAVAEPEEALRADDDHAFYRAAAASEILAWRHRALRRLTLLGPLVLDVFPEELTSPLINSYLGIKAQHLL